jgi:hypothetical protein
MKMNINNHNNKGGIAVLCPFGCGVMIKSHREESLGKNYYTDIRTGDKHYCQNKSQDIAAKEASEPQLLQSNKIQERTEKANQAIIRIKLVNILQAILDFSNEHHLKEEGQYRLVLEEESVENEK